MIILELADAEQIYANIIKDFPSYLNAHISLIQKLELAESKNSLPLSFKASLDSTNDLDTTLSTLNRIVSLADAVINGTNVDALLAYYGLKSDSRADAAKIKTEMDKQKTNLLDAYVRKVIALGKINIIETHQKQTDPTKKVTAVADDIDTLFTEAGKFIDQYDQKVIFNALQTINRNILNKICIFYIGVDINIVARLLQATLWQNDQSIAKDERRETTKGLFG